MKFNNLIKNEFESYSFGKEQMDPQFITVYPLSEYNLEGVKILYDNCKKMSNLNNNVKIATVDPKIWLGQLLDKHFDKISYVSSKMEFNILKIDSKSDTILNKSYNIKTSEFSSEEELDEFFNNSHFKTLVVFSIIKNVDLVTLKAYYKLRFTDITETFEVRDKKIKNILDG